MKPEKINLMLEAARKSNSAAEAKERLKESFENDSECIFFVTTRYGFVEYLNRTCTEWLGWEKSDKDLLRWHSLMSEGDMNMLAAALGKMEKPIGGPIQTEVLIRHKDKNKSSKVRLWIVGWMENDLAFMAGELVEDE